MANFTTNYNLTKPTRATDTADINVMNSNMDIIDGQLKTNADAAAAAQTNLNNHIADYVRHPGYAVTTGSSNIYAITLNPAPTSYVDGMGVVIKPNATNTGASTLNVNGLGAKPIKKQNGDDLSSWDFRLDTIYTLRYSASANSGTGAFILQ
ncbi:hypothetical protein [Paenibacillus alkalitolerans]|uniref:hypothetical protein n=1 Tax=Paenibacillus alkalitolerans TaxID=2799335 RepID=UPI0018F7AA27|nr:hypothetical protein [Paenibacillus alkalitolerans]